jgi:hypothetical protein
MSTVTFRAERSAVPLIPTATKIEYLSSPTSNDDPSVLCGTSRREMQRTHLVIDNEARPPAELRRAARSNVGLPIFDNDGSRYHGEAEEA